MSENAALIERLENAEAGSRELDREILWAWFPEERKAVFDGVRHISTMTGADGEFWFNPLESRDDCPHYSTSMDDAELVVPEGCEWLRKTPETMTVYRIPPDDKTWAVHIDAKAATKPLALCAAALRAKEPRHD